VVDRQDHARVDVRRSGRLLRNEVDAEATEVPARGLAVELDEERGATGFSATTSTTPVSSSKRARPAERREARRGSLP
jgi:hypothetical protein